MQQTEKYKLNLIERDDTFSPDALNENAQKAEQELTRLDGADAALEARADGLEGRVTALEVHHVAAGAYKGNANSGDETWRVFPLGFTPEAVFIQVGTSHSCAMVIRNCNMDALEIIENGFQVRNVFGGTNYNGNFQYTFLALA